MKLGTRGSQLAMWQATTVARLIRESGGPDCEIVVIRTSGDEPGTGKGPGGSTAPSGDTRPSPLPPDPPASMPAPTNVKRLFVKEIEEALLDGRIDFAVHSSKDMPAELPPGLGIGAVLPREDARDAVLLPAFRSVAGDLAALRAALGEVPRLGTSSVRRVAQLSALFPGAEFAGIRGNLDTRLRKLDAGECDAIVLASAGLRRLGFAHRISFAVPVEACVPAPGQGIIAIEHRENDVEVAAVLARINDREAADALAAERAVVRALGGGCQMPLGAHARVAGNDLDLTGVVISPDGRQVARQTTSGPRSRAAAIGEDLAAALLKAGAGDILDAVRRAQ